MAISEPRMARMVSLVGFRPVMSTSPEAPMAASSLDLVSQ